MAKPCPPWQPAHAVACQRRKPAPNPQIGVLISKQPWVGSTYVDQRQTGLEIGGYGREWEALAVCEAMNDIRGYSYSYALVSIGTEPTLNHSPGDQPFSPLIEMPRTKYCCKKIKINIGGSVAKTEPAITMPYCTDVGLPVMLPMTVASPTGKVRVASLLETMKGQTKLFQLVMKVRMATVVRAGPDRGYNDSKQYL